MLLWILGCMYIFKFVFSFFLDIYTGVELLDHMAGLFLAFWGASILFSLWLYQLHSHQQYKGSLFSTASPTFVICRLLDDGHSDWCEVISLWFWFAILWWISTCKRMRLEHFLTPYTKMSSKWIKDLSVRPEMIKLLQRTQAYHS